MDGAQAAGERGQELDPGVVSLSNVSVIRSPGKQSVVMVAFEQDYRSSGLAQRSRKRQYWVEDQGRWKIAYEAAALGAAPAALPESFPERK